jgi:putative nucleotidyltransferase with HDIG domain
MYRETILERISKLDEIPTQLKVSLELNRALKDPNTSAQQVGAIIRLDPALTGKVLKVANSALYAGYQRIVSLQQAISRLGFSEIRRITMTISVINGFKNYFVDYEKFWLHSITTAYLATELFNRTGYKGDPDEAYIAGILHDIGILILDQYFTTVYKKVFEIAGKKRFDLQLVEQKTLGISHPEVGSYLLSKWKLPEAVTGAVLNHHTPQYVVQDSVLPKVVYLANFICNNRGIDNGSGFFPEHFYDDIWDDLGLSVETVPEILEKVGGDMQRARELLRIGGWHV